MDSGGAGQGRAHAEQPARRKRELGALLPSDTGPLYKIFALAEHGRALFEATRKMELEGIVAKRSSDPYHVETVWYAIRNPAYRQSDGRMPAARPRRPSPPTEGENE